MQLVKSTGGSLEVSDCKYEVSQQDGVFYSSSHGGAVLSGQCQILPALCKGRQCKRTARLLRVANGLEDKKLLHSRGELDQSDSFSLSAFSTLLS